MAVHIPFTVASQRIDPGNRLMLSVTPSDIAISFPVYGADPFYVGYGAGAASSLQIPFVPVNRTPPPGVPPNGAGFTEDPFGAICTGLNLPC